MSRMLETRLCRVCRAGQQVLLFAASQGAGRGHVIGAKACTRETPMAASEATFASYVVRCGRTLLSPPQTPCPGSWPGPGVSSSKASSGLWQRILITEDDRDLQCRPLSDREPPLLTYKRVYTPYAIHCLTALHGSVGGTDREESVAKQWSCGGGLKCQSVKV
ncbi:hypothetical protein Micbo1qcDRAFT_173608 [Microdochium bolleyi]|uniref:Uncharacterized protein n=1 Tax=Microdochium bolleyi TaxID=196109 RepID=A0A136JCF8_9PEZI|nr:hypothetical protein Micbo1qcDRAFT_173608 [Microdochium bolleyi]